MIILLEVIPLFSLSGIYDGIRGRNISNTDNFVLFNFLSCYNTLYYITIALLELS